MKRIVGSALALVSLAACEPTVDPSDESNTRFSDREPIRDPVDDDLQDPAEEPDWNVDDGEDPVDPWDDPYYQDVESLVMREGQLRGDVGPVQNLSHDATEMYGSRMDGWVTFQTTVRADPRIAMTIVDFMGDIDALERGRTYHYDSDGATSSASAPWLSVIGCAAADDPDEGFDYDQPAEEVEVVIEEPDEATVEVEYDATFGQYDDNGVRIGETTVHGRFVYER